MSDSEHDVERLVRAWDTGAAAPADLRGTLDIGAAYSIQVAVLHRRIAEGARHAGWKIGQTNAALRAERGETERAPGFMLADQALASGARLEVGDGRRWLLEPELALVLGKDVRGPGVTVEQVQDAVAETASAFELVQRRAGWEDRTLVRAVNGSTAGFVLGPRRPGCPGAPAIDELRVLTTCNGEPRVSVRGGDVNDNPLESTAWLANFLARHGEGLGAGQVILTGSYSALLPLAAGQRWRSEVGALGAVELEVAG